MSLQRRSLLLLVVPALLACPSKGGDRGEGAAAKVTDGRWGSLSGKLVTVMPDAEQGGRVLVLLHGYGGRADSPAFLRGARVAAVRQPRLRIVIPDAPLRERKGHAWWSFEGHDWPPHAGGDEQGDALKATAPLAAARAALRALLKEVQARHRPQALMLAGYSQGGMMAMDLALTHDPPVERVAVLSGTILAASLPGLRAKEAPKPAVFATHGLGDRVLPFASGERLKTLLERHGHRVLWRPYEGGHGLPPREIFDELVVFLGGP